MSTYNDTIEKSGYHWRIIRWILWRFIYNAAQRVLIDKSLRNRTGGEIRWLQSDIDLFLSEVSTQTARLRPLAQLGALPNFGSRLMVELDLHCGGRPDAA